MSTVSKVYIGVDVSKDHLDVYIQPNRKFFKIPNTKVGIKEFVRTLGKYEVAEIACESTGGYEKPLARYLKKNSLSLRIIPPERIKGFIVASGCKTKTDKIDAQKIAEFASKNPPDYVALEKTDEQASIQALVNRKQDLTQFLAAEKTRLKHPSHQQSLTSIRKFIKTLEKEIKAIDKQIQTIIKNDEKLNAKAQYLESIPGIGKASAALFLSFVPELGKLSNRKISALVGVCPYDRSSGKFRGKKYIRGGRLIPRNALYMCALTTIKYNLILKEFYDRLIAKNKPFKVAIVAVMHKLIIFANSVLKKERMCHV